MGTLSLFTKKEQYSWHWKLKCFSQQEFFKLIILVGTRPKLQSLLYHLTIMGGVPWNHLIWCIFSPTISCHPSVLLSFLTLYQKESSSSSSLGCITPLLHAHSYTIISAWHWNKLPLRNWNLSIQDYIDKMIQEISGNFEGIEVFFEWEFIQSEWRS